jgi:hypothetical protein
VSIKNFVADLGQFALIRWRTLPDNGKCELEDSIGVFFHSAFKSTSSIAAELDSRSLHKISYSKLFFNENLKLCELNHLLNSKINQTRYRK